MNRSFFHIALMLIVVVCCSTFQSANAQFLTDIPEPIGKLPGTVLLHGGGGVSREIRERFVQLAGGPDARIVVIPTADADDTFNPKKLEAWREFSISSVEFLHCPTSKDAHEPTVADCLAKATAVWFSGGDQCHLANSYLSTPVEAGIKALLERGGAVGGSSAGAAIASRVMLMRDQIMTGLDILPGSIVDQHFAQRNRLPRLLRAIESHPDRVGFGIDERTAMIVKGRRIEVIGEGEVTVCLSASANRPQRVDRLPSGGRADLVALSRAAQARASTPFPPPAPPAPRVNSGSLVIVGGGGMPEGLLTKFIQLAGGEDAPLVYIPCTEEEEVTQDRFVDLMKFHGAKNVTLLHTKDRRKANSDERFLEPLKTAKGIWFGGGRQWNFVDSYHNTLAHKLMLNVLERGGVVGGSSAGASIQGDYMPRGDPLGNLNIIAEGYERGLGFITGVAIDQHFSQRGRFADMSALMSTFPQLLGIGIDEGTAIVVRESTAEVVGDGKVAFYDYSEPKPKEGPDYISVSAGKRYDLQARKLIEQPINSLAD